MEEVGRWRRQFGVPGVIQRIAPTIVFLFCSHAPPPQAFEVAVEILTPSLIPADIVLPQSRPINGARQSLQPLPRNPAENASSAAVGLE